MLRRQDETACFRLPLNLVAIGGAGASHGFRRGFQPGGDHRDAVLQAQRPSKSLRVAKTIGQDMPGLADEDQIGFAFPEAGIVLGDNAGLEVRDACFPSERPVQLERGFVDIERDHPSRRAHSLRQALGEVTVAAAEVGDDHPGDDAQRGDDAIWQLPPVSPGPGCA